MGVPLTRRQFLRKSALVAATFPLVRPDRGWSLAEAADATGLAVPMNLELVTVTDTSAIFTWFTGDPTQLDEFGRPKPVAAPGKVLVGPSLLELHEVDSHAPTAYHYVEVTGLRPGTRYWFRAESNGVPALGTTLDPFALHLLYDDLPLSQKLSENDLDTTNAFTFVTMTPPPGQEVLRFAWFNDMHFGELISGIMTDKIDLGDGRGFPPGFKVDPANPYWRFMGNTALDEAVARGANFLLVNGDLTNEAEPAALAEIKATLDRFGTFGGGRRNANGDFLVSTGDPPAYWVTRGNHDRAHTGPLYEDATPVDGHATYHDTFRDVFHEGWAPGATTSRFTVVVDSPSTRWRFIGLDSNNLVRSNGEFSDEQLGYLDAQLSAADEPSFVLCHHPAGFEANLLGFPPIIAGVAEEQAKPFRNLLARHRDNVIGVYAGHTHRNNRTRSPETGDLPFYEGGSTKEYPGGYTIVRMFEGGYMVNFYKTALADCRAWSERSRGEYFGLYPYFTLGALADRNWVYSVDARVRTSPLSGPSAPPPAPMDTVTATTLPPTDVAAGTASACGGCGVCLSCAGASLPTTGGSGTTPLLVAGAALATGLAARAIIDDHRR
jgi:hypothetical protein